MILIYLSVYLSLFLYLFLSLSLSYLRHPPPVSRVISSSSQQTVVVFSYSSSHYSWFSSSSSISFALPLSLPANLPPLDQSLLSVCCSICFLRLLLFLLFLSSIPMFFLLLLPTPLPVSSVPPLSRSKPGCYSLIYTILSHLSRLRHSPKHFTSLSRGSPGPCFPCAFSGFTCNQWREWSPHKSSNCAVD